MEFKNEDRVRFKKNVNAAYGPPDRRAAVGTVVSAWKEPTGLERLDLLFDGKAERQLGLEAALFEKST